MKKPYGEHEILFYNDTVDIIYEACTACYNNTKDISFDEKKKYISKRVKCGHESVLEHGFVSFIIHDISTEVFTEKYAEICGPSRYLNIYMTQNEDDSYNLLIGGSIRAYKALLRESYKNNIEFYDNFIINHIRTVLYETTVKEFYEDIIDEFLEDNFTDMPLDPYTYIGNITDYWSEKNNIITDRVTIFDPLKMDILNKLSQSVYKYGFMAYELETVLPITVLFKNISRTATHQLVRHRNAITQESQRYVDYSKAGFTIPNMSSYIEDYDSKRFEISFFGEKTSTNLENLSKELLNIYEQLVSQGLKKEDARAFLPSNVQCGRLYMTFSIDTLRKFLELRTDPHAQTEIREYALDIKGELFNLINNN